MTRIVWTLSERHLINDRLAELYRDRSDLTRKVALQLAQEALPPNRRAVISDQRVFNYKMAIERAQHRAVALRKRETKPREPVESPAPIHVPPPAPEAKGDPTGGLAAVLERLLDVIADRMADRVADRVAERVLLQLPHTPPAKLPVHVAAAAPAPTRVNRPGVWLLGVTPQMGHAVREKYRDRLDIDYLDSDEAAKRAPTSRAHLVMMTRFVSHVVQERWKKCGALHYCNGGLSALETILDSL